MALKFLINRSEVSSKFLVALKAAKPAGIESQSCLLEVEDGKVSLTTSDREMSIRATATAQGTQVGRVVLPVGKFAEVFRNLPGDISVVEVQGTRLVVKSGSSVFRIPVLGDDAFVTSTEAVDEFKPLSWDIIDAADGVSFSSVRRSSEEGNGAVLGVVARKFNSVLYIYSANSHRCCFSTFSESELGFDSVVFPMKLVDAISDCRSQGDLSLADGQNSLQAKIGESFHIICRKRAATPAAVEKVLQRFTGDNLGCNITFEISREALQGAIKGSGLFGENVGEGAISYFCRLRGSDRGLIVESLNSADSGTETLVKGPAVEMETVVQVPYLREFLSSVDSDQIKIGYTDKKSPIIITGESSGKLLTYVLYSVNR